jgi:chromate reductase
MPTSEPVHVIAFVGSLRRASVNALLLRCAIARAPQGMTIEPYAIHDLPLYNGDEEDEGPPAAVVAFKSAIATADALMVVTPEYNFGMTAVTKNALDWASRPSHPGNVLAGKPVSIMAASGGPNGNAAMARGQVRQALVFPGALTMPNGDLGVRGGHANFGEDGSLTNQQVIDGLDTHLGAFAEWARRMGRLS